MPKPGKVSASSLKTYNEYVEVSAGTYPTVALPPVTTSLVGHYTVPTWDAAKNLWRDNSGKGNHAVTSGNLSIASNAGVFGSTQTFNVLQGDTTGQVIWPQSILPSTYTLFYVARYNTSNSSTAPTQLNFKDGTSTTGAFTAGTGGGSTTSQQLSEVRMAYNSFETSDGIWAGPGNFMNSASPAVTSNTEYIATFECRTDNPIIGDTTSTFYHGWDSTNLAFTDINTPVATFERKMHTMKFATGATFSLGNMWVRGLNKTNLPYSSTTYAYFRNMALYSVPQRHLHQIFCGYDRVWYSGFYAGYAGAAYQGNRLVTANYHSNNWVLGTAQNATLASGTAGALFRTNKVDRFNSSQPTYQHNTFARMAINPTPQDGSLFQVAEVIVYDRTLSTAEITSVENYLSTKYGI